MKSTDDPARMTLAQRLLELAAILARGILRRRVDAGPHGKNSGDSAQETADFEQSSLDFCRDSSPHVDVVNRQRREAKT